MKKRVLLLICCLSVIGCTPPPPNLTPAAATAFTNHRVQNVLDQIRDIAQDGNATSPPVVSTATARKVTVWHESTIKIVHATGSGWQATVNTSLDELLKDLPAAESHLLTPYVALAKTILAEVQ